MDVASVPSVHCHLYLPVFHGGQACCGSGKPLRVNKATRSCSLSNSLWIVAVSGVLGLCLSDQTRIGKTSAFRNNEAVGSILRPVGVSYIDSIFSWARLEEVVVQKTIE